MMLARASCPDRAVQTRALNRVTMADLMASEGGDKRSTRMLNRGGANASNQAGNRSTRMLGAQELASAGIPSGANRPGDRGTRMLGASDVARAGMSFCPVAFGRQGCVWDRDCQDMGIEQMGCVVCGRLTGSSFFAPGVPGTGNRAGDRGTRMLGAADLASAGKFLGCCCCCCFFFFFFFFRGARSGLGWWCCKMGNQQRNRFRLTLPGIPGAGNRPGDRGTRMLGAADLANAGSGTGVY